MPATTSPQAKAPIPPGQHRLGTCPTCGPAEYVISAGDDRGNLTRSRDPDADGRHEIHPHHDWCPVLTGETPEVACPTCGAPVHGFDQSAGVILTMPGAGPFGRDDHWVGNVDDPGYVRNSAWASKAKPAPDFDRVTLSPCGHQHEGRQGHEVLAAIDVVRAEHLHREAEATIARHAEVLDAATTAGHGNLADLYRQAVLRGSGEASGLLVAVKAVVGG